MHTFTLVHYFPLQEVIALTSELITSAAAATGASSGGVENDETEQPQIEWKVGDTCMALYQDDGQ